MLKKLFFWIVDVLNHMKPVNWSVERIQYVCGQRIFKFFYNGKTYKYIGYNLPANIGRGFFAPIRQAVWNGKDVTGRVIKFAGPRHDFYGKTPDLPKIFYKVLRRTWIPKFNIRIGPGLHLKADFYREMDVVSESGTLEIINILGQTKKYSNNDEIQYTVSSLPLEQDKTSYSQDSQ